MSIRLLPLVLIVSLAAGCATKGDLRDLQADIAQSQAAQERLIREVLRQNAAILDSLHTQDVRMRGDFTNQLVQLERHMVQIQELTGQGQQQLAQVRETLRAREEALRNAEAAIARPTPSGDPDELLGSALAAMARGSRSTARAGLEEFVEGFPQHPRAPEARLALAGLLYDEGQVVPALEEYSRILELHPDSPQAASALFRAALIESERGNNTRARSLLNQLTAAYPGSQEAGLAREELRRLR
jgi:TolA-binding protein